MITKPEKIIKRIIKAVGERQPVFVIGDWDETLIKGIGNNQNSITIEPNTKNITDNSFTRIVVDYDRDVARNVSTIYKELRRLLLPTGMIIISANCEDGLFRKILGLFKKPYIKEGDIKKIKPKVLQDQIHDNGFLIDGYYGYPGNHLLMMAVIQNKNVTTLFTSDKQETIVN
ncbi:MAG: hypothetical protein A3B68_01905 [Candidatus Melainabacteria bacterium RIFCSPHIGHO2_02_FULL_34_12]|nr:MAG: hypothetical protein A3B68_01905 [Candidatus Melainabacteria bacterium RIFCSPHIGHO2_02_FULL_34_12]